MYFHKSYSSYPTFFRNKKLLKRNILKCPYFSKYLLVSGSEKSHCPEQLPVKGVGGRCFRSLRMERGRPFANVTRQSRAPLDFEWNENHNVNISRPPIVQNIVRPHFLFDSRKVNSVSLQGRAKLDHYIKS